MSLKRYFSQVPSSVDQSSQKKAKQSQPAGTFCLPASCLLNALITSRNPPPDLPPLDNELLPLLDLSSPSLSLHDSIIERFDKISEHLFRRSYLVCCSTRPDGSPKRVLYELLEFEFYLIKVDCHPDPFTHDRGVYRAHGQFPPTLCMV